MKSSIAPLDGRLGRVYFYRTYNFIGCGVQPELSLNGLVVGKSIAGGFFFTDCAPGDCTVEGQQGINRGFFPSGFRVSFRLNAGQTVYIRTSALGEPCTIIDSATAAAAVSHLKYDGAAIDPALAAKRALEAQQAEHRRIAEKARQRKAAQEERQRVIGQFTGEDGSADAIFKLKPSDQFSISEVTEMLLTWKNQQLDKLLRSAKTEALRGYVDQIEHTILQATDAAEREKDEAQRLAAAGAAGGDKCTESARAYRLRIEVLKPILTAIKQEVANRSR